MRKIRRWVDRRQKVVWTEPKLPPYVKFNPNAVLDPDEGIQPGDISMGAITEEFLSEPEDVTPQPLQCAGAGSVALAHEEDAPARPSRSRGPGVDRCVVAGSWLCGILVED